MGWTEIHNAVQAAVVQASGYPSNKVLWMYQNSNAPALPYIAMRFATSITKGQDYVATDLDLTRPAGQEYRLQVKGLREVVLEIDVFTDSTADASDGMTIAELVKSGFLLPPIRGLMTAVELTPFDPGTVQNVSDIPSVKFRGRANFPTRCYVPAVLAQAFVGYIETFSGTLTISGGKRGNVTLDYGVPEDS